MPNTFGFDSDALNIAASYAEKEARNIYHYGHSPEKPTQHEHTANGECSPACKVAYLAREAAAHIKKLETLPACIEKIIAETEGYFVIPAIKEFLAGLQIKAITLDDTYNIIHDGEPDECDCADCLSGKTLKKFGVSGNSPGAPVISITSLDKALPGSAVSYLSKTYTKGSDHLWKASEKGYSHQSKEFAGAIQSKSLIWSKHTVLEEDLIEKEEENTATAVTTSPWFMEDTKVNFSDLETCPPGSQIQVKMYGSDYGEKMFKKVNGNWAMSSTWNGGDYSISDLYTGFDWFWKEPKGNTACSKAKAEWKESNSPKKVDTEPEAETVPKKPQNIFEADSVKLSAISSTFESGYVSSTAPIEWVKLVNG